MSTGAPAPLRPNTQLSAAARWGVFLWLILVAVCGVSFWFSSQTSTRNSQLSRDLNDTRKRMDELQNAIQQAPKTVEDEINQIQAETRALKQRQESVEQITKFLAGERSTLNDQSSAAESQRSVQRAEVAILATQVKAARERLQKLKSLDAGWKAQRASLMTGDPGRRVASSPAHLELAESLLAQERPTAQQLEQWTLLLEALAPPVETAAKDQKSELTILPEHAQQLADLAQALVAAESMCNQQPLLLAAYFGETAGQAPHAKTLEAVLQERRQIAERSQQDRLRVAQQTARDAADQREVARLEQLEQELGQDRLKAREQARRQDEERVRQRERDEQERKAQEARLEQAATKARNQGLKAEADKAEEALRLAQLNRELDRVMPDVNALLAGLTTPGYKHRPDGTKGPISLTYVKSQGALEQNRQGLMVLHQMVSGGNDRPLGALPVFIGTNDAQWTPQHRAQIEKAQNLLNKYGEVLVQRQLLDP
jgi:hypothetical protein